jgi:mannose/fructose/N-acetylgalactosamine-specific phosphotransferase system component IIB
MICQLRIDDRLIHGQVAMAWCKELKIEGIVVINDEVAKDEFEKLTLDLAKPSNTSLLVLGLGEGIKFLKGEKVKKYRVLVIVNNSSDALEIAQNINEIRSINIGGLRMSPGKKMISHSVAVDEQDICNFQKLVNMGIELEIRQIPSDPKISVENILKLKRS